MDPYDKPTLTTKEEKYKYLIESDIISCANCEPHDGREVIWVRGIETDIMDLLDNYKVPNKFRERVVENIVCPDCGTDTFDMWSSVGVKSQFEKDIEKHYAEVNRIYGKKVLQLDEELEKYPLLALKNKFAREIFKEIEKKTLPITRLIAGEVYFKARKVESEDIFLQDDMNTPPIGKPLEGRFNHSGQSHLYLSNDKHTAMREVVNSDNSKIVWLQKFKIKDEIENILDLSFNWDDLTPTTSAVLLALHYKGTILRTDRNKDNWRPDYYITRFIMDCAKMMGYKGVKYDSAKAWHTVNVVLFNQDNVLAKGNPKIKTYKIIEIEDI